MLHCNGDLEEAMNLMWVSYSSQQQQQQGHLSQEKRILMKKNISETTVNVHQTDFPFAPPVLSRSDPWNYSSMSEVFHFCLLNEETSLLRRLDPDLFCRSEIRLRLGERRKNYFFYIMLKDVKAILDFKSSICKVLDDMLGNNSTLPNRIQRKIYFYRVWVEEICSFKVELFQNEARDFMATYNISI